MPTLPTAPAPETDPTAGAVSVVVPCHNERGAIAGVLDEISRALAGLGRESEIIAVDDGSTDGTADAVDTARFRLVRLPFNLGYGSAIKAGVSAARHGIIVITDADGTYPNERIGDLLAALDDAAMAVGARTGETVRIPAARRPAKWFLTRLAAYLAGQKIPDLNSGFRAIRRELFERYEHLYPKGFSLTTTITLAALTNGHVVHYVPINYHARVGTSKIRPVRDTLEFLKLIVRTVLYFDPLKVFLPLGLGMLALSLLVGVVSLIEGRLLDVTTVILFVTGVQTLAIGALADLITRRMK